MPRRSRITFGDVPAHLIQRGNNRSPCFFSEDDYHYYLEHLNEACREEEVLLHAYVLMTNHIHLLLTPRSSEGISRVMKRLGQRYVQYINRTYHRSGTLWEGRFRSCLVQEEDYLLGCYRYIELNPVRAAMVAHPDDYPWSSYHSNALGVADALLTPHPLYQALGIEQSLREFSYRELFRDQLDSHLISEIRSSTNGGFILGREAFQKEIGANLGRRTWRGAAGRPPVTRTK
jgi:putative transposase